MQPKSGYLDALLMTWDYFKTKILNLDFTQYPILLRFFLISEGYMWSFIKACIKICNLKPYEQINLDKMEQFIPGVTAWKLVAVSQALIWTIKFCIT